MDKYPEVPADIEQLKRDQGLVEWLFDYYNAPFAPRMRELRPFGKVPALRPEDV
jgi:hypothetical protein